MHSRFLLFLVLRLLVSSIQFCGALVALSRRQALVQPAVGVASALIVPSSATIATTTSQPTTIRLSDGTEFPICSFGLQIYNDDTAYRLTRMALDAGYRNFFASELAGNLPGFAHAIRDSVTIPRSELYICGSVVSNRAQGYDSAYQATTRGWQRQMQQFTTYGGINSLNQIMLDYPGPDASSIQGQWKALEDMHAQGKVQSLSVSNFSTQQLDALLETARIRPVVNQLPYSVAYHPNGQAVMQDNRDRGIVVQAWAPLGKSLGGRFNSSIRTQCELIGRPYNKTWAQVALRWIVQNGGTFTTQSQNVDHFRQNVDLFDFQLSDADMDLLTSLAA